MDKVIIVGSGLSGTGAAVELVAQGICPLILDVGHTPDTRQSIDENLYEYRKTNDIYDLTIGPQQQGLANLLGQPALPVKLTTPHTGYITAGSTAPGAITGNGFSAIQSFALGGLANAWGAGCYRFDDADLQGFPIRRTDLDPYYDRLTQLIGISGEADDLAPYFGPADGLQAPLQLGRNMETLYRRYRKLAHKPDDIVLGRARIGALSESFDGRPATSYRNLEFCQEEGSLYSPRHTLQRLADSGQVRLIRGMAVQSWREGGTVEVCARDELTGELHQFTAGKLVLAAGAINSAKLVLASSNDYTTTLPLLENPALQIPLLLPGAIGRALQTDAFGLVQLNLVWESAYYGARLQGSLMEITAPSRAEFYAGLPLCARANLQLIRHLLPAMAVMQLFFPGNAVSPATLSLQADGSLRINADTQLVDTGGLRELFRFLRRLGAVTARQLVVKVPNGHAIHYAGTLPMQAAPSRYQCHPDGRLQGTQHVYIADSATLTGLPAKNMSFSMMANAMRIAAAVANEVHNR